MRTSLALAIALLAARADGATISLTEPSPLDGWIEISISGEFHVDPEAVNPLERLVWTNSEFDKLFLEGDQSYTFWNRADALFWVQLFNQTIYFSDGDLHAQQYHFGEWLTEEPNAYQNATTIEMVGGDIIDLGGGEMAQEWTYTVDGGTPAVVQVAMVPEPGAAFLACVSMLALAARRR